MAEKRMFTKKITNGDEFTTMPPTAQCLYFHLCMGADDDGFSNNIRIALFNAHATTDDFNILVNKRFIIPFESGVIVIKHWRMHNYIQNDRHHDTKFIEERSRVVLKENGVYTECIQPVSNMYPEIRLDKNSIDKNNINNICSTLEVEPAQKSNNNSKQLTEEELKSFQIIRNLYPKGKNNGVTRAKDLYRQWIRTGRVVNGKRVKLENIQIWDAVNEYLEECKEKETPIEYIKNIDTLLGNSLMDYVKSVEEIRARKNK